MDFTIVSSDFKTARISGPSVGLFPINMNRPSIRERLACSFEAGSSWALRAVIALGWYWVRQVGRVRRVSRVRRVGENEDVGPIKLLNTEKPRTSNGAFLSEVPIALFSGRWLLLRANGKL